MAEKTKILTIAHDRELKQRLDKLFRDESVEVIWESNTLEIVKRFGEDHFDILLFSAEAYRETKKSALEMIRAVSLESPATQILLLVEPRDIRDAIKALKAGTYHYAKLPVTDEELRLLIQTALDERPQYGPSTLIKKDEFKTGMGTLIGRSSVMQDVYARIEQAATVDIPILLLGETGTGKDLAARLIHQLSNRREEPYVPVNLGALPIELVASELFGHDKGAYTGAVERRKGVFEQADKGTVYLDEIDSIDEKVQVSLLRLLEEKKFNRLGGRKPITSNARLIAASNSSIEDLTENGRFRKDLFYRLDVFRINMPPLRERRGDIPLLTEKFIAQYSKSFSKEIMKISPEVIELLEAFEWPGNVRELKNVIQRAVLICKGKELVSENLPPRFLKEKPARQTVSFEIGTPLSEMEREMVIQALAKANNNRTKAAELLGISRRAVYSKLRKFDLD